MDKDTDTNEAKPLSECSMLQLQHLIHINAQIKGFWDRKWPSHDLNNHEHLIPEKLCLIHSEVSEALEAYRNANMENFAEELADTAIRVMDLAEAMNIDLQAEIVKKHLFNLKRSYRHGGKQC